MAYAIQNSRDKAKLGSKAPWYAVWKDVDGKKHSLKVSKQNPPSSVFDSRQAST